MIVEKDQCLWVRVRDPNVTWEISNLTYYIDSKSDGVMGYSIS